MLKKLSVYLLIENKELYLHLSCLLKEIGIVFEKSTTKISLKDTGLYFCDLISLKKITSKSKNVTGEANIFFIYSKPEDLNGLVPLKDYCECVCLPTSKSELIARLNFIEDRILLKNNLSLYRKAFNLLPDVICINRIKDGLFLDVNQGFSEITGYSKEEILGKSSLELNIWHDQKDRDKLITALKQKGYIKNLEAKYRLKDGRVAIGLMSANLIYIGNEAYTLSATKDIGELKKTQEQLAKNEKLLKDAQRIAGFGCWELDITNNKLCWSDEVYNIFEIPKTEFETTYEAFLERVHPEDRELVDKTYKNSLRTGKPYKIEYRVLMPDGRVKWMLDQCETYVDKHGNPIRSIGTILDITERKSFERTLKQHKEELEYKVRERTKELEFANKELESFAFSVSHDLRAPLRAIDGFSKILEEDYSPLLDAEAKRIIKVIRQNTKKMRQLIDDLLNFSKVSRHSIKCTNIDMTAIAQAMFFELTDDKLREKIDFRIDNLPHAWADPSLIKRVFYNLLSNAIKFTSKESKPIIHVGFKVTDNGNVYFVKDNGVGFNMKYKDKLFKIFQRVHDTNEFPGTGVGLSIVQRIVCRHGGTVWADAQEGQGATFYFNLGI